MCTKPCGYPNNRSHKRGKKSPQMNNNWKQRFFESTFESDVVLFLHAAVVCSIDAMVLFVSLSIFFRLLVICKRQKKSLRSKLMEWYHSFYRQVNTSLSLNSYFMIFVPRLSTLLLLINGFFFSLHLYKTEKSVQFFSSSYVPTTDRDHLSPLENEI